MKRSHKYFYKIQEQMLSAQLLTLLSTSEKMHHCMLRLTFDEKFWQQILTQILFFFSDGLLSLSSSQRVKKVKNCINMMAKKRVKKKLIF